MIKTGKIFVAVPPLFRIDVGADTYWAADEEARIKIVAEKVKGTKKYELTRFKGLGEMMPKTLWQTTLDPKTRRLLKVEIQDNLHTDRVINDLMGKDPSARFRFIMDRADEVEGLDV